MNVYTWLLLLSSVVSTTSGISVYLLNRKAWLNRTLMLGTSFFAYWALTEFLMRNSSSLAEANFWNRVGFLWPFAVGLLFQFSLFFTDNRWAKRRITPLLIYAPALFFSFIELTTSFISGPAIPNYWGYVYSYPQNSALYTASNLWGFTLAFGALLLCLRYYSTLNDNLKKAQTKFVSIGIAIPIAGYLLTNELGIYIFPNLPPLGNVATMAFSIFIGYAVWKYELFSLNPAVAAENIIETIPDSFVLADPDGKIVQVNQALVELLGYGMKDLRGESVTSLFYADAEGERAMENLSSQTIIKNSVEKLATSNGQLKYVSFSGSTITNDKRNIGFTIVIHDLTEIRQMEEKLVKSERLASIGELSGQLGHDLRNPLAGIKNGTYYLRKKGRNCSDADRNKMLDIIDNAIEDSDRIIRDLLEYSSELKLELRTCSIQSIIAGALSNIKRPEKVIVFNSKEPCLLLADESKLQRAFSIIIKNAFEAMPTGGQLHIRCLRDQDNVKVEFQDTGSGIPEKTLRKLFTPLNTTKAKGMGFSLAICKRIVDAHGGSIDVKSELDHGTTFAITLPLKPQLDLELNSDWLVMSGGLKNYEETTR